MKSFRPVLVGFVFVSCFFLTGLKKHSPNQAVSAKSQHSIATVKPQKLLDLAVPLRNVSLEGSPETLAIAPEAPLGDALSTGKQRQFRAIELHGHFIMSPEPETEKMKSTDGAGILINLRH